MKMSRAWKGWWRAGVLVALMTGLAPGAARAVTNVFFNAIQGTNLVTSGTTSDTISSAGYLFTYTRDKLFTGGVGLTNPIGRYLRVYWPVGLEAQAVTAGPNPSGARLTIQRQGGGLFDLQSFTFKLLANTGGAGASIEVMPQLNGEDAFNDPIPFDATGYYGGVFHYVTPILSGYDTYKFGLYVDFALLELTVVDDRPPPPVLEVFRPAPGSIQLIWPTNAAGYRLEVATSLPGTNWALVTNQVTTNGEFNRVSVASTAAARFYRLKK